MNHREISSKPSSATSCASHTTFEILQNVAMSPSSLDKLQKTNDSVPNKQVSSEKY